MAVIRRAREADTPEILRYDTHIAPAALIRRIRDGLVWTMEEGFAVVGTLRYGFLWGEHPFLELLYLDSACRGKGLGRLFLSEWEGEMRALGYRYALTSTQEDETAWRFYEKLGYERCGFFLPPEQEAAELIYRKRL